MHSRHHKSRQRLCRSLEPWSPEKWPMAALAWPVASVGGRSLVRSLLTPPTFPSRDACAVLQRARVIYLSYLLIPDNNKLLTSTPTDHSFWNSWIVYPFTCSECSSSGRRGLSNGEDREKGNTGSQTYTHAAAIFTMSHSRLDARSEGERAAGDIIFPRLRPIIWSFIMTD